MQSQMFFLPELGDCPW